MSSRVLYSVLASLAGTSTLADETFRCGQWIVTSELAPQELRAKCGAPTSEESSTQDVLVRNRNNGLMVRVGETRVSTWTYDRGTRAAPMVVTIVDGKIKSIDRKK
jgi:hypothetical protein